MRPILETPPCFSVSLDVLLVEAGKPAFLAVAPSRNAIFSLYYSSDLTDASTATNATTGQYVWRRERRSA